MSWIDISQQLDDTIPVWPGDTPFSYEITWPKSDSGSVNVGQVTMSVHTGTHIDAPFHFDNDGKKVLELDLDVYIGDARVIDVSSFESIGKAELSSFDLAGVKRLLLKTSSVKRTAGFPESIPYLREDAAPYLEEIGVVLVGVDVPSVDPLDSKELKAHHSLFEHGIHILENAVLHHIAEGDYELIALPLALKEADGSPVRAILKKKGE